MEVGLRDYLAGAALATDLVLTEPGLRLDDRLTTVAELGALLDAHGVPHRRVGKADLADARALRDEIGALVDRAATSDPSAEAVRGSDAELVQRAGAILARCPHRVLAGPDHLTAAHGDWRLRALDGTSAVQHLHLIVGASTLAVLHALGSQRFRRCAATDSCSGAFVDTSNTGRRRFCLPKVCGNRVNVARYRARRDADRTATR